MQSRDMENPMKSLISTKMNLIYQAKILLFATGIGFSGWSVADILPMPVSQQGEQSIQTPRNGLSKEKTQAIFGEPLQKISPVGEPPISKWVYPDFTVYFENNIVLHAVLNRR